MDHSDSIQMCATTLPFQVGLNTHIKVRLSRLMRSYFLLYDSFPMGYDKLILLVRIAHNQRQTFGLNPESRFPCTRNYKLAPCCCHIILENGSIHKLRFIFGAAVFIQHVNFHLPIAFLGSFNITNLPNLILEKLFTNFAVPFSKTSCNIQVIPQQKIMQLQVCILVFLMNVNFSMYLVAK